MGRQASITSFFHGKGAKKVQQTVEESVDVVYDLTKDESSPVHVEHNDVPRKEGAATLSKEAKEELRSRWQRKVLGESDSMRKTRPKTQQEVAQQDAVKKFTPLEKQVVELHRQYHPDCVLAIECGYKYKFFGVDAEIASKVLGIFSYPDRNFLTASVPTARIQYHVRRLVNAGYEVGIVSQTETAAIKASDAKTRSQPFKRELTKRFSPATIEAIQPGAMGDTGEKIGRSNSNENASSYVVCVMEGKECGKRKHCVPIGIVAVECSTGSILQASFVDCAMRMQLESALLIARPSDMLIMDSGMSPGTQRMLETYCQGRHVRVRALDAAKYALGGASTSIQNHLGATSVDAILKLDELVLQALAHTLDYLTVFGLGKVIQSESQIRRFSDVEEASVSSNALQQLEILRNSDNGTEYGSLVWLLDQTKTAFGSRMMHTWITSPLKNPSSITQRLDAVEEILHCMEQPGSIMEHIVSSLKHFDTDLERSLGRIIHGTIQPAELWSFLDAFKDIGLRMGIDMSGSTPIDSITSPLLKQLLSASIHHDTARYVQNIATSLHKDACLKNDIVMVLKDTAYSDVKEKRSIVAQHEKSLENLKPVLAKSLGVASVEYVAIQNQGEYLIEVPVNMEKRVPSCWVRVSSTKKMVRFLPPEVKREIEALELAREYLVLTAKSSWNVLLGKISEKFVDFKNIIHALASLDCLISFASISSSRTFVKPEIVSSGEGPLYKVHAGRHPIIEAIHEEQPFVPNDITIGSETHVCMVITGPNMGGKSVYQKQAAIIAYMAQIGCFVPALSCILRPFDAIFTRMGAADSIALGRSTFLEELAEASQILQHATSQSLVIIDELGRGTSSGDGYAVAAATMRYLAQDIGCASLFVTHYPDIAIESSSSHLNKVASPYYMGYLLDRSRPEHPKVTFTYTVTKGVAHSSYGLNVASMAGVPESVVKHASQVSACVYKQLESARMEASVKKAIDLLSEKPQGFSLDELRHIQEVVSSMLHPSA